MSVAAVVAPAAKTRNRSIEARRKARAAKAERERLIVDLLNRGVAVAEIAARIGVTEKRMRAIVKEILARRRPETPEDFVALQVGRLNEALLIAYDAMSAENLRAVALVVRIVRELDRYHGLFPAGRRGSRNGREVGETAEEPPAPPPDRLQTAAQSVENAQNAPGNGGTENRNEPARTPLAGAGPGAPAPDAPVDVPQSAPPAPQEPRSAPENDGPAPAADEAAALPSAPAEASDAPAARNVVRPETPPRVTEEAQLAPGNGAPDEPLGWSLAGPAQNSAADAAPSTGQTQTARHTGVKLPPPDEPFYPTGFRPRVRAILNGVAAC
jgi:transposase-like protein